MLVAYPLNLTMFFRLPSALHDRDYPAHWLADVLFSILDNRVHTTARPPRIYPYSTKECNKTFANRRINIMPFVPEMRTLTALWLSELPFGLAQQPTPPKLNKIRRYSVHFTSTHWDGVTSMSVFNLLFAKETPLQLTFAVTLRKPGSNNCRPPLLFDEKQDTSPEAKALRTNCAIVSTWTWNAKEERGTFWMDEDTMETWLKEGDWRVTILRQDSWRLCAMPEALGTALRKEKFWIDRD